MAGRYGHQQTKIHEPELSLLTTASGVPIGDKRNSLTVGPRGPLLIQDAAFMEEMAHFNRERIPERVVHARGAGAFGYFEVTNDITQYCKAKVFSHVGKKTPIAVRFSTTTGELGSNDTVREPHGFAIKFYTEEGNWDLVGNHTPAFFIKDPILFPSLAHAQKKNPQTHLKDPNMFWDFVSLCPETLHEITHLFTDRGLPDGYRHMHGFGNHAFKLVNADGKPVYCKFHYKTNQGIKNLSSEQAKVIAGSDPDHALRDLLEAIAKGDYPSWTFSIQIMTFEQAEKMPFNPFDVTKVWYQKEFPLIPVGKLVLNRNPTNYFADVEQIALEPKNLVPGIEPSPDRVLQGRLFAYSDALRYRLGVNYTQIPVNRPQGVKVANYERDGHMVIDNQGNAPSYYPNSFGGPKDKAEYKEMVFHVSGDVDRYHNAETDDNFQVRKFYQKVLNDKQKQELCQNIASSLTGALQFIQDKSVKNFAAIDPDYGARVQKELDKLRAASQKKEESKPIFYQQKHY
ncbi:catalase [Xenopus tropicalis]|nr:catalase [Xenopus tropicalis]|eukprot:XP_002934129.2 PREDICTED: catalase-like [Xenopus tropicalis]